MSFTKDELIAIVQTAVTSAFETRRAITDEQHFADHEWARCKREAELVETERQARREKYMTHIRFVALGAVTITGIALAGKGLAYIGELVYEAWKAGLH